MKFSMGVTVAALAAMASAKPLALNVNRSAPSALEVNLATSGNTGVTATIKNNGSENLNLLRRGTILDDLDIEKVYVFDGAGSRISFNGIRVALQHDNIPEGAFIPIKAGETITIDLDSASLHDLSAGGKFEVQAKGIIPVAKEGSTVLTGEGIAFESNTLEIEVDGLLAATAFKASQSKMRRSIINGDCQGEQLTQLQTALSDCGRISATAAGAARSGDVGKFAEYFKTEDQGTRDYVAGRLDAAANECATTGTVNMHCTTPDPCDEGVLAFAIVGGTDVYYCPSWFGLPQVNGECHGQDKWGTALHEITHSGVFNPDPTDDFAYFYDGIMALSADQARLNADTYALYAQAINVGC